VILVAVYNLVDIRKTIPRHPTRKWKTRTNVTHVVVHTTGSSNQDPAKTAAYHISVGKQNHISALGCPGLAYADFITKDGTVYHCNSYTDITWHASLYNSRSIGVVMAFEGQNGDMPLPPQYEALLSHLVILCLYIGILPQNIIGHREVPGMMTILGNGSKRYRKSCPGMAIDLDLMRKQIATRLQERLKEEACYSGEIDGIFGPKSQTALKTFRQLKDIKNDLNG
jgi:N-acetyl-anhydromuramyl-L-alanine amidase AmpD